MSVTLRFDGLEELKAALRNLPTELTAEATHLVEGRANAAATEIRTIYGRHRVTGHLQDGVTVTHTERGKWSAGAIVKSAARHAWIFEYGTEARHYITINGKVHNTGEMWGKRTPPRPAFVGTIQKHRRALWQEFRALLERHGLLVREAA